MRNLLFKCQYVLSIVINFSANACKETRISKVFLGSILHLMDFIKKKNKNLY